VITDQLTPLINLPYICVFDQAILRFISKTSIADQGCLSIPDPDFYTSRIPDLGSRIQKQQQKREGKKFVVIPFFVATNFRNFFNYFIFEMLKKKIWASF
jgi:hypothetical protein